LRHAGPIAAVAAGASYVATAGYDNQVILWDRASRVAVARGVHDHLVNHCAFSHDGTRLVSAGSDYSARVWALPSMRLAGCLLGHEDDVDMAVFSPDDRLIATCALDRMVRVFEPGGRCLRVFAGHTGNIISLDWSPDGASIVSCGVDGTVRVWDLASGEEVRCYDLQGVRTDTIAVTADGVIYAGDDDGRIVELRDGVMTAFAAHAAGIKKIVWQPEGRRLVSLSYDRTLAVWAVDANRHPARIDEAPLPPAVWARAACALGRDQVAAGTFGGTYATYDLTGRAWSLDGVGAGPALNAVCAAGGHVYSTGDAGVVFRDGEVLSRPGSLCNFVHAAGGRLFCGGQLGEIFDGHTGDAIYRHHSPLNCAAGFTRGGRACLAVGAYTGEVLVFDIADGGCRLERTLTLYENAVKGLAVGGDTLFVVCANRRADLIDLATLASRRRITGAHDKIANGCCALMDGGFATVGRDRTLRLWFGDGCEVHATPHPNSVKTVCANAAGTRIASGAYTGTIAIFDVPSRSFVAVLRPTASGISGLAYDAASDQFVAASYDGNLYTVAAGAVPARAGLRPVRAA